MSTEMKTEARHTGIDMLDQICEYLHGKWSSMVEGALDLLKPGKTIIFVVSFPITQAMQKDQKISCRIIPADHKSAKSDPIVHAMIQQLDRIDTQETKHG
jgi:hypothetical protein